MHGTFVLWTAMFALTGPADDLQDAPSAAESARCQVLLIADIEVPAQEAGPLVSVAVTQGELVQAGQQLAQLDDVRPQLEKLAAELELDAALTRARDDIEVRYAVAAHKYAEAELNQNVSVNESSAGAVVISEIRRLRLAKHRAALQIDRSQLDQSVAEKTAKIQEAKVRAAEASIERRRIVAPFDGAVVEVLREQSEWVDAGQPVFRVIRLDKLRVDAFLDLHQVNPEEAAGKPVTVEVERARGRRVQFSGQITVVSPIVQAGERFRVQAEVDNKSENGHWLLRPGMNATMVIEWDAPVAEQSRPKLRTAAR